MEEEEKSVEEKEGVMMTLKAEMPPLLLPLPPLRLQLRMRLTQPSTTSLLKGPGSCLLWMRSFVSAEKVLDLVDSPTDETRRKL